MMVEGSFHVAQREAGTRRLQSSMRICASPLRTLLSWLVCVPIEARQRGRQVFHFESTILVGLLLCMAAGCNTAQPEVVVYTALDREFSEPVLNGFSKSTDIKVLPKYDDESTKTVGLTSILIQEAGR